MFFISCFSDKRMLPVILVSWLLPQQAFGDFIQGTGVDFGKVPLGETRWKNFRVCNETEERGSAHVYASWISSGGGSNINGPFNLDTVPYNLQGNLFRSGECHNIDVSFTPSYSGRACGFVYFFYSYSGGSMKGERLVCGEGVVKDSLYSIINLIIDD
jgi:hypothetical protein